MLYSYCYLGFILTLILNARIKWEIMKFVLTIYVCSFLHLDCAPGVVYPEHFDTWKECVIKAFDESKELIISTPQDVVESNRLTTKYTCTPAVGI
jgi:hypothetical protein